MQIYLAPMEGITTYIYRNAVHKYYGGFDRYFTPFLANKNLNYKDINDVLPEHNQGIKVIPQILANQVETFLSIAKHLEDYGYREVNLNLGCPSGTVVAKKRGAGFLAVPDLLDAFLEEIFDKCPLSVSVKTRIGIEAWGEWEELLRIYAKYPMTELIIHPRFQKEFYDGRAHPEGFVKAAEAFRGSQTRLCYNGDIVSVGSFAQIMEEMSGRKPDAVMLGRGAIACPGLQNRIREQLTAQGENLMPVNRKGSKSEDVQGPAMETGRELSEACDTGTEEGGLSERERFRRFHDEILTGYMEIMSGDQPVLYKMKELWFHMGRGMGLSDKQMKQIKKVNRIAEYKAIVAGISASVE